MYYPVIIFSADKMRGGITQEVLQRNSIKALWISRIFEVQDTVLKHASAVVIIDTRNALTDELYFLKNFCRTLRESFVIVIGSLSIIDTFEGLRLADPFDPELIVSTIKNILQSKTKDTDLKRNTLESDLKQFLKLDT